MNDWGVSIISGIIAGLITGIIYHIASGRQLRNEARKLHEATNDVHKMNILILRTFEKLGMIEYSKKDGRYVGLVHRVDLCDTIYFSQGLSDAIDEDKKSESSEDENIDD
ncbi:hypothetical protein [Gimesia algae]|uniref:Uncharacterized protein n=1 Tax=Gimesia algae TaxID=2527971 RepID=A0A517V7J9_9PLAN|nr:hypothetical protein [Gimesia algae]QDT88978.1 hypothetical protein Pan161_05970 [Gimesia algae]